MRLGSYHFYWVTLLHLIQFDGTWHLCPLLLQRTQNTIFAGTRFQAPFGNPPYPQDGRQGPYGNRPFVPEVHCLPSLFLPECRRARPLLVLAILRLRYR